MTHQLAPLSKPSQLVNRTQQLQTVAVEASDQLRDQTIQLMQAQSIRLEDMADTEIEGHSGMDQCLDELMQCILYTELRKDVREVTDKLEEVQHRLFSSEQDLSSTAAAEAMAAFSLEENSNVYAEQGRGHGQSDDNNGSAGVGDINGSNADGDGANGSENDDEDENNTTPTQISTAETFQTARGMPMFSDAESSSLVPSSSAASKRRPKLPQAMTDAVATPDANSISKSAANPDPDGSTGLLAELLRTVEQLEQQLYGVCVEIHEWRRSRCVAEFISAINATMPMPMPAAADHPRSPSADSSISARIIPIGRIIGEARERQRVRASSLGHQPMAGYPISPADRMAGSLRLSTSPPLSRLLQAEREAESLRALGSTRPFRSPSLASHFVPAAKSIQPTDETTQTRLPHFNSLRLIDTAVSAPSDGQETTNRHRTFADDVRIVGWVTKGSGLDVHTEFKVVVHLTRGENLTVMRRYTDFADLRGVLCERYPTFRKRIPQLPPKKAFGKFENRFLKKRESGLQFFLAYVMLHPVIGCSSIIRRWIGNV
ncbi:hypothetical protein H4R99_006531 [Coemansia sp. RSA 1722]|nr:hypothetical protein IWW45_002690 [Coemansia sp. RSA 485]KAJ2592060.1 hypothetical protein H4R99_006531 [Coemansia sp. RSA 1722]